MNDGVATSPVWEERSYAVICVSSVMLYGAFIYRALLSSPRLYLA